VVSQAPIVGQASGNFILPATAQGATLAAAMPANFQAPIFPNTLATPNSAPGIIPSLLMTHQFQPQLVHPVASKKRGKQDTAVNKQQPRKKKRELEPSVVSSTTSTESSGQCGSKEAHPDQECASMEPQVDLSRMTASERRRYERNLREQQRSYKISQQVKELREVLAESNVPFKPNKYSILLSVVEYIKQLQARAIMLDAEHQKLITTIRQTNELVNSGNAPSSADETYATNLTGNTSSSDPGSDSEMIFVQGINYKSVFEQCPAALGIAALDGRILECNFEFQLLLGFARDELMKQSLFNLVQNHQDIFRAMAEMLKSAEDEPLAFDRDTPSSSALKNCVWSGPVISKRDAKVRKLV
jgi:PAS domain-containing protein